MEPGKDQMARGLVLSNRMGQMPVPGFKKMIGLDSCQTKIILAASWKVSYGRGRHGRARVRRLLQCSRGQSMVTG